MTIQNPKLSLTDTDREISGCLDSKQSFAMVAGAGSGKTTSLTAALKHLRKTVGDALRRDSQQVACITYTNRAVDVISSRLNWDEIFQISTLHKFLWDEVRQFTPNIREALQAHVIPERIRKKQEDDNGGQSKKAVAAREMIKTLNDALALLNSVESYYYSDSNFSDYSEGQLSHDDVVEVAAFLITGNEIIRRIIGQKYPYIFVDEAQDTSENVVAALNKLCEHDGLPVVGYFGDPMQQIYDKRAGNFHGPQGSETLTKEENYRCSESVIQLLNAFRTDLQQFPAGENKDIAGTVLITLVKAEAGEAPRKKYTEEQTVRAADRFRDALVDWDWHDREDVKQLFLARRMIARRLGFPLLHDLFTGEYASSTAQDSFEAGEHFLLVPFITFLCPLIAANRQGDDALMLNLLREHSATFDPQGDNSKKTIAQIAALSKELAAELEALWAQSKTREILEYCREKNLIKTSDRLTQDLTRAPREEEYDAETFGKEKSDWLSDAFFDMPVTEIESYVKFVCENTPFSTQHGVKGEEYKNVVVVFDDTEAAWTNYSFRKVLAPNTSGTPTDGQRERSMRLAYVCFSRAEENLRVLLFTEKPAEVRDELIEAGLFQNSQISILGQP